MRWPMIWGLNLATLIGLHRSLSVPIIVFNLCLLLLWTGLTKGGGPFQYPPKAIDRLRLLFVGCALLLLALQAQSLGGIGSLIALLSMLAILKLYEYRGNRDRLSLFAIHSFLLALILVTQQSWGWAIYVAAVLMLLLMLMNLSYSDWPWQQQLRFVSVWLLSALPLFFALFVLFPRIGPLWKMPDAPGATVGLSESMSPADFAELGRSGRRAFRVDFEIEPQQADGLYWRTLLLEDFDGRRWYSVSKATDQLLPASMPSLGETTARYRVFLDPSFQPWLPALQPATIVDAPAQFSRGGRFRTARPVTQMLTYQMNQHTTQVWPMISMRERQLNLRLPPQGNPQARDWAQRLWAENPSTSGFATALLSWFTLQPFYYTLKPGTYGENDIDTFLFERRRGFCAHYAGAMVFMARSAGIPARVVAGYLGGEWQPDREYLTVYQYDAHAWVELWSDAHGWQVFDPTAAIAPERVELGLEASLAEDEPFLADAGLSLLRLKNIALFQQLHWLMANLDFYWANWVLGYSPEKQAQLLADWFGEDGLLWRSLWLGLAIMTPLLLAWLWQMLRQRPAPSPWRLYQQIDRQLPQLLQRQKGESYLQHSLRLAQQKGEQPDWRIELLAQLQQLNYRFLYHPAHVGDPKTARHWMQCRRQLWWRWRLNLIRKR